MSDHDPCPVKRRWRIRVLPIPPDDTLADGGPRVGIGLRSAHVVAIYPIDAPRSPTAATRRRPRLAAFVTRAVTRVRAPRDTSHAARPGELDDGWCFQYVRQKPDEATGRKWTTLSLLS
jgi:hypothetical protein